MTICANCKHFMNVLANPAAPDVWYNFLCKAAPNKPCTDPITGKQGYEQNGQKFAYCRDLNNGNCPMYEEKETA